MLYALLFAVRTEQFIVYYLRMDIV